VGRGGVGLATRATNRAYAHSEEDVCRSMKHLLELQKSHGSTSQRQMSRALDSTYLEYTVYLVAKGHKGTIDVRVGARGALVRCWWGVHCDT
jgi:hypothetical protein